MLREAGQGSRVGVSLNGPIVGPAMGFPGLGRKWWGGGMLPSPHSHSGHLPCVIPGLRYTRLALGDLGREREAAE